MAKKKRSTVSAKNDPPQPTRTRSARRFPALTFEEALALPDAIQRYAAGQRVRRLTLFEKLDQAPEGSKARRLITGAGQYGLTKGNYSSEFIELTTEGREATGDDVPPVQKLTTRFNLAIDRIEPFKFLYEKIRGNKLPAREIMADYLAEIRVEEDERPECIDVFVLNVKFLGLLRTIAGSERLVTLDQAMENATDIVKATSVSPASELSRSIASPASGGSVSAVAGNDYGKVCFYISPIGEESSEPRRHSDFLMEYIIRPALKEFDLALIRADQMGKPGMIGKQVIEHIIKSRLVIADLSFHNPNVFYELCLRHTTRLPTVQIIKTAEDTL